MFISSRKLQVMVKRVRKVSPGFLKISEQVSIHQSLRADPHIELERVGRQQPRGESWRHTFRGYQFNY